MPLQHNQNKKSKIITHTNLTSIALNKKIIYFCPFCLRTTHILSYHLPWIRKVNSCKARRTSFNLSLVSALTKLPSLSNFAGGSNAFKQNNGLLMKWISRKTPTWRRWYCARSPPPLPPVLIMAAALLAQAFGGLDAQSIAFFKGAKKRKHNTCTKIMSYTAVLCVHENSIGLIKIIWNLIFFFLTLN